MLTCIYHAALIINKSAPQLQKEQNHHVKLKFWVNTHSLPSIIISVIQPTFPDVSLFPSPSYLPATDCTVSSDGLDYLPF